ncbi:putative cysteine desulfurase [Novipirellula aureliae]|uniref:Putative cysteine desulfurase n=1 Tax=Novipirellula aureliae TaxID=2527966 RepID=A0A5C6EEM4_9BACT|nr:aminotransferase class V-fold PLP-dependent enzyme [Novipirellula aureliae]TWU45679.1 putative cysteine desulfurase [Novipirellula aureliae]
MENIKNWQNGVENDPWQWWRGLMPITESFAYFDHGAVGALSFPAVLAIENYARQASTLGDTVWPEWAAANEGLRKNTASLMNCHEDAVCLIPNTSTGINYVAEGWDWKPGDNVVIPEGEFPSNLFPWKNQEAKGVELRIVPRRKLPSGEAGEVRIADLVEAMDESTKMVAASWVGYATGYRLDIDELVRAAHNRGVLVFLDAIQGLGVYPLDLAKTPVDFLAADGHKWLLGPEGAGVAMIRTEHLPKLRLRNIGWGSVRNSCDFSAPTMDLKDEAARYESGSANMVGLAALSASMQIFLLVQKHHGRDAIEKRVVSLTDELDQMLKALGVTTSIADQRSNRSGILNFSLAGVEPTTIRSRGLERNVVLSCRGTGVRASVHAYNNRDDMNRLVDLVKACLPR